MAFTFGAKGAVAPGATPGGFSFGSTPAAATGGPAPAPAAPATAFGATPSGGTSAPAFGATAAPAFGSTPKTPSLGSTAAPPSATLGAAGTSAIGAPASGTPKPVFGGLGAPAPGSLVGSTPASGGAKSAFGGFSGTTAAAPSKPTYLKASDFETLFPGRTMASRLQPILNDSFESNQAQQDLLDTIPQVSDWLLQLNLPAIVPPNNGVRQQLKRDEHVQLYDGRIGPINAKLMQQINSLSDDLRIPELDAVALLERAGEVYRNWKGPLVVPVSEKALPIEENAPWAARELFFENRTLHFQCLLHLWQWRVGAVISDPKGCYQILKATDSLLEGGLIRKLLQFVRDCTKRVDQWTAEVSRIESKEKNLMAGTTNRKERTYAEFHRKRTVEERQAAVECLYFISYQAQLECHEVVEIINLIHELGDQLPLLNPIRDVPDILKNRAASSSNTQQWWNNSSSVSKSREEWEREWVELQWKNGKASLSRIVAVLTMCVVAALDTKSTLMDRKSHSENHFGPGNALLPPGSSSFEGLQPLNQCLSPSVEASWVRKDILGLLMGAQAMLLRSSQTDPLSPVAGSRSPIVGEIRRLWRERIEAPKQYKSYTYGRICLVPVLQVPASSLSGTFCDVSEFLLSTLSDFAANILDVLSEKSALPISRAKWTQDSEEDLKLRRKQRVQEQDFAQRFFAGGAQQTLESIPDSIDLMERHDCMDDLIAFASSVCSLGPAYALKFWSVEESRQLSPSRALRDLRDQQMHDASLRASYISFLAALALAKSENGEPSGAILIHDMLSAQELNEPSDSLTYASIMNIFEWYNRELSADRQSKTTSSKVSQSSAGTAYYYFSEDSVPDQRVSQTVVASKPRELGEDNIFLLLSYLTLISNIADSHPQSRIHVLDINIPAMSPDGREVLGQSSALEVLFTLVMTPLSPEVRGQVFTTIGKLTMTAGVSSESLVKLHTELKKCWELIESFQILPIHLLEQYDSLAPNDAQSIPYFRFPPHSTSLVGSIQTKACLPADARYSILYEMEHVEAATGVYPATTGFLSVLRTLVKSGVHPQGLGHVWRSRRGCSPYIEYVVDFVLPRATGTLDGVPALPFRSCEDALGLISVAFEVVEAALSGYILSKASKEAYIDCLENAKRRLGMDGLASTVVVQHGGMEGPLDYNVDFSIPFEAPVSVLAGQNQLVRFEQISPLSTAMAPSVTNRDVPSAKSMGLYVLCSVLSSSDPCLFKSIVNVFPTLTSHARSSINSDTYAVASALYGATPPSFLSAKDGPKASSSPFSPFLAIQSLRPNSSSPCSWTSKRLRGRAKLAILRLLCAVVAREATLQELLSDGNHKISLIPVLNFRKVPGRFSQLKERDMQLESLAKQIESVDHSSNFISELIGCLSGAGDLEFEKMSLAAAVVFYADSVLSHRKESSLLVSNTSNRRKRISRAFGSQMICCAENIEIQQANELLELVINTILSRLRQASASGGHLLVWVLMGLKSEIVSTEQVSEVDELIEENCFAATLRLLNGKYFERNPQHLYLGMLCHEVLYCMIQPDNQLRAQRSMESNRLRIMDFFRTSLPSLLSTIEDSAIDTDSRNLYRVHSLSWLLKTFAVEIEVLSGQSPLPNGSEFVYSTKVRELFSLLHLIFDGNVFSQMVNIIPLEKASIDPSLASPPKASIAQSKYQVEGSPEVVEGYSLVDGTLLCKFAGSEEGSRAEDSLHRWADQWNLLVMRECSATHMGNALHKLFGSISLAIETPGIVATFTQLWFRAFTIMLNRMHAGQDPRYFVDAVHYTTATRNLALAVFMSSEIVRRCQVSDATSIAFCCKLMAGVIAKSHDDRNGGIPVGTGRIAERTAILAFSLTNLLETLSAEQSNFLDQADFEQAAAVLAGLAAQRSVDGPNVPSTESVASRLCLIQMLRKVPSEEFCRSILTNTGSSGVYVLDDFIALIPSLDADISNLLITIASIGGGSDLMIQRGVLDALQSAATRYQREEAATRAALASTMTYAPREVVFPPFLLNHFRLMSILLASEDSAVKSRASDHARFLASTVACYKGLVSSLVEKFPFDGDKVQVLIRLVASIRIARSGESGDFARPSGMPIVPVRAEEKGDEIESLLATLALRMAESILPSRIQGPLPRELENAAPIAADTGMFKPIELKSTWWDSLGIQTSDNKDVCIKADLAASTIRDVFMTIRRSPTLLHKIGILPLTQALFRFSNAMRWAECISRDVPSESSILTSKLSDLIQDTMALIISFLRHPSEKSISKANREALTTALTRISSQSSTSFSINQGSDENSTSCMASLVSCLRHELARLSSRQSLS